MIQLGEREIWEECKKERMKNGDIQEETNKRKKE
jgi:hypothetical protein